MRLVIKTGMRAEYDAARQVAAADVSVITGTWTVDNLKQYVPLDCGGIISFGLCGGLGPLTRVGQTYIYSRVVTPLATHLCDAAWRERLFDATHYTERGCWSSGEFNTANDEAQRAALYAKTGCTLIDDETRAVAEFATLRNIPHIGLRVVSDGAEDNLPPAVIAALNSDGTTNLLAVLESVISDPAQIPALMQTARDYGTSVTALNAAARAVGPYFQSE